jgi:hypothetical protein
MREYPDFQLGGAEFPVPEIMISGYAPFARPSFDGLRMKAAQDHSSACTIEKRFNGLKLPSGCAKESLTDSRFDLCVWLSHCANYFLGFLPRLFLRPCSASKRVSSAAIAS